MSGLQILCNNNNWAISTQAQSTSADIAAPGTPGILAPNGRTQKIALSNSTAVPILSSTHHHNFMMAENPFVTKREAGQIAVGDLICMRDNPCKVTSVNKSASGKHGHTKCNFVAVDIISGKTYEDIIPETHLVDVPKLERYNYLGDFMLEGVHMASADQGFNGAICGNVEMPNENLGLEQGDVVSAVTSAVSGRVKIVKKEMNYRR